MRITLTLDDDVASKLRSEVRKSGEPFKQVVNRILRTGLNLRTKAAALPPYRIKARPWGSPGFNYDKVWDLLGEAEGPYHR